ncbi:MAG TPA: class I SAM-dependent methyltransferase [Candidatus Acidoferrum sp.]|nr:class I SAM-dependent methyltransferase [Candidatus Acidoferrum sp.]
MDSRRIRPKQAFLFLSASLLAVFLCLAAAQPSDQISRLAKAMGWKAGQTVADIGAGDGQYAFAASSLLGENGRVYATELDEKKLQAIKEEVARRGLKNVVVLQAAETDTNLPENCCDAIFLRRVYHHLTAPQEINARLMRNLKPGGLLAIIDFPPRKWLTANSPVKGVPENRGGHGIPQKILVDELTAAGFTLEQTFNDWPEDDYCVIFRKPAAAAH